MSPLPNIVTFVSVEEDPPLRLASAQKLLVESILNLGLTPLPYPAGRKLVPLGEVLSEARSKCSGEAFVWCNSDVILVRNPYDVPDPDKVFGFHRRELPSGRLTKGVDMYYIPVEWWDDYLAKDIPHLFVGASYVDWWISRAMEKADRYGNLEGYIDHPSHGKSSAAGSGADPYYQSNFRAYNRWAKRNGLETIPAPRFLIPRVGHAWGVRDALRKLAAKFRC